MLELYDRIGVGYRALRVPDPRIAAALEHALGDAASVANIGAGAGSYEPRNRRVVAIEPSLTTGPSWVGLPASPADPSW